MLYNFSSRVHHTACPSVTTITTTYAVSSLSESGKVTSCVQPAVGCTSITCSTSKCPRAFPFALDCKSESRCVPDVICKQMSTLIQYNSECSN
jgi:hypothetical protein